MNQDEPIRHPQVFPQTLPIFPLAGALLLPRGQLPLNIFEARYLQMIDDAMRSGDRLIGMIQPKIKNDQSGAMYEIGCAGRIVSFEETEDGRYIIVLRGLRRFRIEEETAALSAYRRMKVDWTGYEQDQEPHGCFGFKRDAFFDLLRLYFERQELIVDWDVLHKTPDEKLISALSMICPFDLREKQMLLEAANCRVRGELLTTMIEIALHEKHNENNHM